VDCSLDGEIGGILESVGKKLNQIGKLPISTRGAYIMGQKASKYQRIEQAEGEKITPSQPGKPAIQKKGQMHTVAADETLSHIALKYYGSAAKEKWMMIYEANQDVIGDNPNIIRKGMELFIPDIEA
jgi:nucleoid-associated protein YgaU